MKKEILNWEGPFGYVDGKIVQHTIDPAGPTEEDVHDVLNKKGIYCVVGDHPIYGSRSLLYIGRTENSLSGRLKEHRDWLDEEWRVEIYFAEKDSINEQKEVEKFLIHAHSPAYNSQNIEDLKLTEPLMIWNIGRYWGLLPELSSDHPWYMKAKPRPLETQDA